MPVYCDGTDAYLGHLGEYDDRHRDYSDPTCDICGLPATEIVPDCGSGVPMCDRCLELERETTNEEAEHGNA